jgi:hypothetical protein
MPRVHLRRAWFAPGGVLYNANPSGVEIPDALMDQLPPGARVVEEDTSPGLITRSGEVPAHAQLMTDTRQEPMALSELQRRQAEAQLAPRAGFAAPTQGSESPTGQNRMIATASATPGPRRADLVETERLAREGDDRAKAATAEPPQPVDRTNQQSLAESLAQDQATPGAVQGDTQADNRPASSSDTATPTEAQADDAHATDEGGSGTDLKATFGRKKK